MEKITLKELQQVYYERLEILCDFFDKNNIQYYAIGGTLLGTIRHNGFIPWDDDVDLAMDRKNYDLFLKKCDELDPALFTIINYKRFKYVDNVLTKIGLNGYINCNSLKSKKFDNMFHIDIFPLDKIFNNEKDNRKIVKKTKRIRFLLYFKSKSKSSTFLKNIFSIFMKTILLPFSCHFLCEKLDKLVKKASLSNACSNDYLWTSSGVYTFQQETHNINDFGNGVYAKFGPIRLKIPENYNSFLIKTYGEDYMTPKIRDIQRNFEGEKI